MRRRDTGLSIVLTLVVGALATLAHLGGALTLANDAVYDRLLTAIPAPSLHSDVVVVAIDDPSFAELDLAWPWPRGLHAALIEQLRANGARRIGYDVVFADPGDAEQDRLLRDALRSDVVLAGYSAVSDSPQGKMQMFVGPSADLVTGGADVALVDVVVDPDGAIRQFPGGADSMALALTDAQLQPTPGARIRFAAQGVPVVSFYQALEPEAYLPADTFHNKVVLVGIVLRSSPTISVDAFRTPLTASGGGFMSGVEIHAQAYRSLAERTWIVPVPEWIPALLAAVLAAATVAAVKARAGALAVGGAMGLTLAPVVIAMSGLFVGVWIPPIAATAAALGGGAGQIALNYLREHRARRHITRVFGHYLAPELVRRLADNPGALELGGERRMITVLFCDLRGFTALSERMQDDPATLTRVVNTALGALAEAVIANQGMVDKFIGDCVMALWNAPADDPDHAIHAIAAGRDMVGAIANLSQRFAAEGLDVSLACGVGINSGVCTVGNMGSAKRFDYTAIGDPVNLASRLETLTKEFGISVLIGLVTSQLAPEADLIEIGTVAIKGRRTPETVFGLREAKVADTLPKVPSEQSALSEAGRRSSLRA